MISWYENFAHELNFFYWVDQTPTDAVVLLTAFKHNCCFCSYHKQDYGRCDQLRHGHKKFEKEKAKELLWIHFTVNSPSLDAMGRRDVPRLICAAGCRGPTPDTALKSTSILLCCKNICLPLTPNTCISSVEGSVLVKNGFQPNTTVPMNWIDWHLVAVGF